MYSLLVLLLAGAGLVVTLWAFLQWQATRSVMILFVLLPMAALSLELLVTGLAHWLRADRPVGGLQAIPLLVTQITVPWETLLLSTVLYVVLPLAAGMATRHLLSRRSAHAVGDFVARLTPWSVIGLIATVVLLFGFQARTIVAQPLVIGLIAITYIPSLTLWLPQQMGLIK